MFNKKVDFDFNKLSNIYANFFLSSDVAPLNRQMMQKNNITHIINLTTDIFYHYDDIIVNHKLIEDTVSTEIINLIIELSNWIRVQKNVKNILIHCNYGISRSPSVLIGFLIMRRIFYTFEAVYDYVRQRRPCVCINTGFKNQLKNSFSYLYDYYILKNLDGSDRR
jgi:protein-tyrosine phosphatase